jgi:alpha-aminoadipate carrier protein LysW
LKAKCPECDADLIIPDDVLDSEIVSCPDCGMDFEASVKKSGKVELKLAEIEGEDWGE